MTLEAIAIGLGVGVGAGFSELLGVAPGGMVVAGYVGLYLHHPWRIVGTVVVSLAAWGAVSLLSKAMLVYGRRRFALMILFGFVLGGAWDLLTMAIGPAAQQLGVIGYVVPGLIANWVERQGVVITYSALLVAAVIVRLLLMLALPQVMAA